MYTASSENDCASLDMLTANNVNQLVEHPTRYRSFQTPSVLDLLLVVETNLITDVTVNSPIGISDHCATHSKLQVILYGSPNFEHKTFSKVSHHMLQKDLENHNWDLLNKITCVQEQ